MRRFILLATVALGLAVLSPGPVFAKGDDAAYAGLDQAYTREIKALAEA